MMTQLQTWGVAVAIGASLVAGVPAWAATDAVKIDAFSDGRGIDTNALHAIRQTVGSAIAASIVDTFVVLSPQRGGPIPREGGLSACAERGFVRHGATIRGVRHAPRRHCAAARHHHHRDAGRELYRRPATTPALRRHHRLPLSERPVLCRRSARRV